MKLLEAAANGTTGVWFEVPLPGNTDKSNVRTLYLQGVLGVGGTVVIEGTQIGADEPWASTPPSPAPTARQISTLTTLTALGVVNISARTRQIRARVSAGDGTTDLDLTVV